MEFNNSQAIYLQIAEYVCDQIQLGLWKNDAKIPSVRELGILLEVNPNTVMRSYDYLQQQEIIYTKRGMGYFIQINAAEKILKFKRMNLLAVSVEELMDLYKKYNYNNNPQ
jgi:GntR family transcriptional regulator